MFEYYKAIESGNGMSIPYRTKLQKITRSTAADLIRRGFKSRVVVMCTTPNNSNFVYHPDFLVKHVLGQL